MPLVSILMNSRNATGYLDQAVRSVLGQTYPLIELIVSEAGGITTTRDGKALRYNAEKPDHQSLICAGPALHARLLQRMGELKF